MSNLIERDELYKALEAWDWQELYLPVHFKELVDEIPTIKAVEVQPDNGWISVTDEMPKPGQRVMAFCRAGILTFLRYDGEVWFEMSSRNEYLLSFVTHWQHLPKPPSSCDGKPCTACPAVAKGE